MSNSDKSKSGNRFSHTRIHENDKSIFLAVCTFVFDEALAIYHACPFKVTVVEKATCKQLIK